MVKAELTCQICLDRCTSLANLKLHYKLHQKDSQWACPECPKTYLKKSKLIEHTNRHRGTPEFKCSECSKEFYRNDRLKTHLLTHTGERPYACDLCSWKFRRKYELNKHKKTHSPELVLQMKKHICLECGKKCYSAADLRRHAYAHTDERPCECSICHEKFKEKYTLKTHEINVHFYVDC